MCLAWDGRFPGLPCPAPDLLILSLGLVIIIKRIDVRLSLEVLAPALRMRLAEWAEVKDVQILGLIMAGATLHSLPIKPTASVCSRFAVFFLRFFLLTWVFWPKGRQDRAVAVGMRLCSGYFAISGWAFCGARLPKTIEFD